MRQRCKAIALLRRREGMDAQAFRNYYEERHAPLILKLLPGIIAYRRNYADFTDAHHFGGAPFDFDVITEICFESRAARDRAMEIAGRADVAEQIAADEENFLDRSATRMFLVDESPSIIAGVSPLGRSIGSRA